METRSEGDDEASKYTNIVIVLLKLYDLSNHCGISKIFVLKYFSCFMEKSENDKHASLYLCIEPDISQRLFLVHFHLHGLNL